MRFGQPSKTLSDGIGALFPFHDTEMVDAASGQRDGLLARAQQLGCVPKVITINTSTEYWGGDRGSGGQSSLLHTDPSGSRDIEPPDTSRVYLVAGAQHLPSVWPVDDFTHLGIHCAQMICALDHRPLQRALLMALDRWVAQGQEPPPSRIPRLADGTAITPETGLEELAMIPGLVPPAHLPELRRLDFGFAEAGVPTRLPPLRGEPYPWFVSAVDSDGNEISGIRHPDIAVPLATYVGFNVRHASSGAPGELVPAAGAMYPFASTADRRRAEDRRPSIAERYRDRETYLQRIMEAARSLVVDGLLLTEDVGPIVEEAGIKYDAFVGTVVASATSAGRDHRSRSVE